MEEASTTESNVVANHQISSLTAMLLIQRTVGHGLLLMFAQPGISEIYSMFDSF